MARLSTATRHKVVILRQQGLSQTKISKQTGVSRCAVQALLKKHKETANVEDRRRSGRPRKLSAADERHIKLISLENGKLSSSAISSELAETSGTLVHPSTVRRSLARRRVAAKKPYLRPGNNTCVLQSACVQSPVGEIVVSGCDKGVHTITIVLETENRCESVKKDLPPEVRKCVQWLQSYFSSAHSVNTLTPPALHHPLLQGESFTACVLRTLQQRVPVGHSVSYGQLAEMCGNPRAARAVGGAMKRNPVPLIIPCHRVLCSSGDKGHYMGGKGDHLKAWLLDHESQSNPR